MKMTRSESRGRVTARCVVPECSRYAYAISREALQNWTRMQGWTDTRVGWLCPTHTRAAEAYAEVAKKVLFPKEGES